MNMEIISKIQKLLNLANNNSFEAESKKALEKAYQIMQEYGISMMDVENNKKTSELGEMAEENYNDEKAYKKWEVLLMTAVTKLFGCAVFRTSYGSMFHKKQQMSIVGREANRITAKLMYEYLHEAIKKSAKEFAGSVTSSRIAYCNGAAQEINYRVNDMMKKPESGEWGLVLQDETQQWIDENMQFTTNNVNVDCADEAAYLEGAIMGHDVSLNQQVYQNSRVCGYIA